MSWAAGRQMVLESVSDARQLLRIPAQTGADTQKVDLNNKCLEEMSAAQVCRSDLGLTPMTLKTSHPGAHCASCWMTTVILHLTQRRRARPPPCTVTPDSFIVRRLSLLSALLCIQPFTTASIWFPSLFTLWGQIAKPEKNPTFFLIANTRSCLLVTVIKALMGIRA